MCKQILTLFYLLIIVSNEIALAKDGNKINSSKVNYKRSSSKENLLKEKTANERVKRSLDTEDPPFWPNRGKKLNHLTKFDDDLEINSALKNYDNVEREPFWGNRGRRDSSSVENYVDYPDDPVNEHKYYGKYVKFCKNCARSSQKFNSKNHKSDRVEDYTPFWGNRGRRNSDEVDDSAEPFWGNRGRRQENEPFWGTRGRRKDSWESRSSEEDEPFWANRGRRDDAEPFWGNRGRRDDVEPFWGNRGRRQDTEPFWGTRGRRQESEEPFWGNRGRRQESDPFWGNRGRRKESDTSWTSRGRRKQNLKDSILDTMNNVEQDIETLSRLRRSDSFWANRGRDSKMKYLFNGTPRSKFALLPEQEVVGFQDFKPSEPKTVHDSRIYAEEPHYIVVERSSRSSAEDDPFYISRGKKYYLNYNIIKAARDRRGAIEEIVKSVRNDPFYIARGKKDGKVENINATEEYAKAKELICSAIDLIMTKGESNKVKRDLSENDRDRRTILKKLAAQLQMDPYFVSRGKKDISTAANEDNLREFINDVAEKCN